MYELTTGRCHHRCRLVRCQRMSLTSSGIGLETALQFASEGAHIVLADINEPAAIKAAEYLNSQYPESKSVAIKCDVSIEQEVEATIAKAVSTYGRLDVLVGGASTR